MITEYRPERQNEISGLMLMGLIGGAIFPPIMDALADAMNAQLGRLPLCTSANNVNCEMERISPPMS
ncbi:hypothetical protein KSU42_06500 [Bifidobacterium breve]|uniref:Uncharacterized protein n=1 Tax=Bifidobacterium breve TaxID=1685 RepID=A0AAP3H9C6_BIFBR|nr:MULTISPECIES: hypothetical protein [Bifidobacterium]MCB8547928.1 hypothetical protein [Bifidobacterium sp. MSK23_125]MCB8554726.1 hypothetical protein [Bifidobacterium sp. MSK23_139]ALE12813.1 Putative glucose/galactose transporter [Bifidobacterium breve]MBD9019408.1 hypothetical protein [Bifidobacterium breve]MBK5035466.1 hypothetical protein [Bifidobacterium breve]